MRGEKTMEKDKKTVSTGADSAEAQTPIVEPMAGFELYNDLPAPVDNTAKEIAEAMAEGNAVESGLMVLREKRKTADGKREYFTYSVKGKLRGVEQHVALDPPDRGGYAVLNMVFGDQNAVPLLLVPYEMTDERTGRKITGNTYLVRTVDENGIKYECKVKPSRDSDKRILDCFLQLVEKIKQV